MRRDLESGMMWRSGRRRRGWQLPRRLRRTRRRPLEQSLSSCFRVGAGAAKLVSDDGVVRIDGMNFSLWIEVDVVKLLIVWSDRRCVMILIVVSGRLIQKGWAHAVIFKYA